MTKTIEPINYTEVAPPTEPEALGQLPQIESANDPNQPNPNNFNQLPKQIKHYAKYLSAIGLASLTAGLVEAPAIAKADYPSAHTAEVAKKRPIRPLQIENRAINFLHNTPSISPAVAVWNVGTDGNTYRGNTTGDTTTWVMYDHSQYAKGPCGKYGLGNFDSFESISKVAGSVLVICADQTSSGRAEVTKTPIRQFCQGYINGGQINATLQECESVNLTSVVNFASSLAATSVGLKPNQYGPGSKVEVTGFNKQAIIDYRRGPNTNQRKLKQLALTLVNNTVRVREQWY